MKVVKPGEQIDGFFKQGVFYHRELHQCHWFCEVRARSCKSLSSKNLPRKSTLGKIFIFLIKSYQNQYPCFETSVRTAKTSSIHFVHFSLALKPPEFETGSAPNVCFGPERTNCFCSALSNPLQNGVLLKQL